MSAGLEVWGQDGTQLISTNTSVVLILGTFQIGGAGAAQSGSISDGRLANGRPYAFQLLGGIPGADNNEAEVTASGTTISWSYPKPDGSSDYLRPRATIMYGTY